MINSYETAAQREDRLRPVERSGPELPVTIANTPTQAACPVICTLE